MRTKLKTSSDIDAMFAEFRAEPTTANRNEIVESFLPLVTHLASKVGAGLPGSIQTDDLITWGTFGLMQAVERFDPARGVKFRTYADTRIRGAIYDGLRDHSHRRRPTLDKSKRFARKKEQLTADLGRSPTPEEIREALGVSVEMYSVFEAAAQAEQNCEDAVGSRYDRPKTRGDLMIDPAAEKDVFGVEVRDIIGFVLTNFSIRDSLILRAVYLEGRPMSEAAGWLGRSESWVSQRHKALLRALRRRLAAA